MLENDSYQIAFIAGSSKSLKELYDGRSYWGVLMSAEPFLSGRRSWKQENEFSEQEQNRRLYAVLTRVMKQSFLLQSFDLLRGISLRYNKVQDY